VAGKRRQEEEALEKKNQMPGLKNLGGTLDARRQEVLGTGLRDKEM